MRVAYVAADRVHDDDAGFGLATRAIAPWLLRPVPALTAQTLAVCRIVLGAGLFYFLFLRCSPELLGTFAQSTYRYHVGALIDDRTGLLTFLSSNQTARLSIHWGLGALTLAFVMGMWNRILYPTLVVCVWLVAFLSSYGHFITPLLLAMAATLIAPWSAAWSVDALARGNVDGRRGASQYYGYPIWLLGFVIGLTYTAAGLSKLIMTNGAWLWDTGARNGFIQDFGISGTDWGMVLSNNYFLSLGASILSALGQAVYVYACFTRHAVIKFSIGAFIALPFLIGLVLFMGLFWWPWALLVLILYMPWRWIDRQLSAGKALGPPLKGGALDRQRSWFLTVTSLLFLIHTYAVLSRTEYEPIYSNYPMYADRMRAGSSHEAFFWSRFKAHDRHYKPLVQALTLHGRPTDWSSSYAMAASLENSLWKRDIVALSPRAILAGAARGEPISTLLCTQLRKLAPSLTDGGQPAAMLRYAKRYIDMVDGKMVWVPVTSWVEVDIATPNCPYRKVTGLLQIE
jgi:hypothetical protein